MKKTKCFLIILIIALSLASCQKAYAVSFLDVAKKAAEAALDTVIDSYSNNTNSTKNTKNNEMGKYEFSKTTYDYLIEQLLLETGAIKGSADYEVAKSLIEASYTFEILKQAYGGLDFYVEFDGKGNVKTAVSGISIPLSKYTVNNDGKIYRADTNSYFGYVRDSVYWCSWDGSDFVIPFTKVKEKDK